MLDRVLILLAKVHVSLAIHTRKQTRVLFPVKCELHTKLNGKIELHYVA